MPSLSAPIVEALARALTEPDGLPLLTGKQAPGLFPGTAQGKQAAGEARAAGLVQVIRAETRGKAVVEHFSLTPHGLACLLERTNPRPVLEALLQAMQGCQERLDRWIGEVERCRTYLERQRALAEQVLSHLQSPEATLPSWSRPGNEPRACILDALQAWQNAGHPGDCPLPELFDQVRAGVSRLTVGQFHDALRALYEGEAIYLHPWTGTLHEIPRPAVSVLVGHEIAYYASLRG